MNKLKQFIVIAILASVIPQAYSDQSLVSFYTDTPTPVRAFLQKSPALTEKELRQLVTNNSIIGHTTHTYSIYELFFAKDGTVIFRKARDNKQVYKGKWWIKDNHIFSQWNTYAKKSTVNELEYHHVISNIYAPYNVNDACGPAGTYCAPFMVLKGDPFRLQHLATLPP